MSKILKPYTIIPANLYVARDADRQIENIIGDMGRPGYVLVSRQMGKTNLLLNAKRKLESTNDVFVYVDLSNPFDSAKACFENIIDTALELNEERFYGIIKDIKIRRSELVDTPAHKQHTNELRMLLKGIKGKLVIILDEIDALTKTNYSDQIFAQIRSVYFSRVNFPELERLTYILSGVVDPNDLIKDPKISPFNIGQKIFLNDFSKEEFLKFNDASGLSLDNNILERVYHWTNGNPRLSWDLCSEIENEMIAGNSVTLESVDQLANIHYLTRYDRPPIDNIREIVRQDRDLRNGIMTLRNNGIVSDQIKNKLYLAGIINYEDNDVKIKNLIIEQSLNSEWLTSIEEQEKGYLKLAVEYYTDQDFENALKYFERYLSDQNFDEEANADSYFFMIGFAYYKLAKFEKALDYWEKTTFDVVDSAKNFYETLLLKGLCYTYLEDYEQAHKYYKQVIDSGRKDENYIKSLINYGAVSAKIDKPELLDETLEIFVAVADNIDEQGFKLKPAELAEVKTIAIYNTAIIYSKKGDDDVAEKYFDRALESSNKATRPSIIFAMINHIKNDDRLRELITELVEEIVNPTFKIKSFDPDFPLRFSLYDLKGTALFTFMDHPDLFDLMQSVIESSFQSSCGELLLKVASEEISKKHWINVQKLFNNLANRMGSGSFLFTNEQKLFILKYACYFNINNQPLTRFEEFAQLLEVLDPIPDQIDVENITILVSMLSRRHEHNIALEHIYFINKHRETQSHLKLAYLVVDHLELNIYKIQRDNSSAIAKARSILRALKDSELKKQHSNFIGDAGLDIISKNAEEVVTPEIPDLYTKIPNYGRNEIVRVRYHDGIIVNAKFKKVLGDIEKGLCIILRD